MFCRRTLLSLARWGCMLSLGLAALPAGAEHTRPEGWKVTVTSRTMLAKQGIYEFVVVVRDEAGSPVENAEVGVLLPSGGTRVRQVSARHAGRGRYRTVAPVPHLVPASAARAVVRPGRSG